MGNRFGRKQKRKLKAQIDQLNDQVFANDQRISRLKTVVDIATGWDDEIASLLGKDSALRLKINERYQQELPRTGFPVTGYIPNVTAFNLAHEVSWETSVSFHRLQKIMLDIKRYPDELRSIIRLAIHDNVRAAMYVDDQYMLRNGLTKRDIEWMAHELARQLADHVNGEFGHGIDGEVGQEIPGTSETCGELE